MKKTIVSSIILSALITAAIIIATRTEAYAQFLDSYNKLSLAEQKWVRRHPIAAFRTHELATTARQLATDHKNDSDLDGDLSGGMADAFKHTLWMALTAQKIGFSKALSLGKAHEDGNRAEFENNPDRNGGLMQDKMMSEMDLYNNNIGARIGADHPDADTTEIIALVKEAIQSGQCRKLRKKNHKFLDSQGQPINEADYKGQWEIPKVLIPSNQQE